MTSENNDSGPFHSKTFYQAVIAVTVTAALFSLLITGILGLRYFRLISILPLQENRIEEIQTRLSETPDDEALLEEVRELDLRARAIRLRWYGFASRAGYLLLLNLSVVLAGAKTACKLKESLPQPGPPGKYEEQYSHVTAMTRRAVATGFVLFIGVSLAVVFFSPDLEFRIAEPDDEHIAESVLPEPPEWDEIAVNWPRFRGPRGSGISPHDDIPLEWDIETGENILWKAEVPLPGQNSPVVWENRVFLTGATETKRQVYCYDAETGDLLWSGDVPETDVSASDIELNPDTGYAASTAYTDGRMVYAFFPTGDVVAFDFDGNRQWIVNLGEPDNVYGHATSLLGYNNKVIVQYDNGQADDDLARLVALDWTSGDVVWETPRSVTNSWTTPIIIDTDYGEQLITVSEPYIIAYDPEYGAEVWRGELMSGEIAPSPIENSGLIMAISPYVELIAVKPQEYGTIDENDVVWRIDRGVPDITSPLSDGEMVYLLETYGGTLRAHSLEDGERAWEEFLSADFYASPALAGNTIYLFSSEGDGYLLEPGDEFKKVGRYPLGENIYASPAFVEGRMYIRGEQHLFCIGHSE